MIRFYDKEVKCIRRGDNNLTRGMLFSYFLNENRGDILCIIDENGQYEGSITYPSLLKSADVEASIQTECVILDEHIWQNGRKFFIDYESLGDEIVLLPVVTKDKQLVCFAYQDEDANREIRELQELIECNNALNFHDVFPDIDCVTIIECNELAYYFAKYLKGLGINVNVRGNYWDMLGNWKDSVELDYRNLNIYAEGTWEKCEDLRKYLLRSVSVEFECIDKIYEKNIEENIIQDVSCGFEEIVKEIKQAKVCIAILGTGKESLEACDLFYKYGIEDICFISSLPWDENRMIAGKPVLSKSQAYHMGRNIVLIDCCNEHSAGGCGECDNFDYAGYRRNKRLFYLKDYIKISYNHLEHLLQGKDIILVGDIFLCKRYYEYYMLWTKCRSISYYNILNDDRVEQFNDIIPFVNEENITKSDVFLIFFTAYNIDRNRKENNNNEVSHKTYIDLLLSKGYYNYIFMPYDIPKNQMISYNKYSDNRLMPKFMILGALTGDSGTFLLRQALENNKIIKMDHGFLNENLILFCIKLSGEKSQNIAELFWLFVKEAIGEENIDNEFQNAGKFDKKMKELLQYTKVPSSQELFVIFHMAYVAMSGKNILDVSRYVIYWEIHGINRGILPHHTVWLGSAGINGLVITSSRNCVVRAGGLLKYLKLAGEFNRTDTYVIRTILESPHEWDEKESVWENIEISFEDLKRNPANVLEKIGRKTNLTFSDVLNNYVFGEYVKYESIEKVWKPVYNTYEEYLSEFDRMRIALITSKWQRKRGYPNLSCLDYTKKELQEIFLREFRFENELTFRNDEEYMRYKHGRQRWIRQRLRSLWVNELILCNIK